MSLFEINVPDANKQKIFDMIKPYLKAFIRTNQIRNGKNAKKRFALRDTIKASREFATLIGIDIAESNIVSRQAITKDFEFDIKDSNLTPLESLALLPNKIWEEIERNWNLFGYEGSPYYISMDVHRNAHVDTVSYINSVVLEIFESKVELDKKLGNFQGTNESWAKSQDNEGRIYVKAMAEKYLSILKSVNNIGADTMNYNDELIAWMEEYEPQFKALSETAKAAATVYFLRGFMKLQEQAISGKNRYPISIPPVSLNKKNVSLLDASIIKLFFNEYNKIVNDESRTKVGNVRNAKGGQAIEILIRKACG
jgi:hypothetical protein